MSELLRVEQLVAGYGDAQVLHRIDLSLAEGRSLALLGRNGAGKTTLLNTLVGVTTHHAGRIHLGTDEITRLRPEQRAARGIGWVPQERNIFASLTVEENLTAAARPGRWDLSAVYQMFPRLQERRRNLGNQLSGGEQQMLAVGRALMLNPRLLLLDEPLEGLAPIIVDELLAALRRIVTGEGLSAIIVEQKARKILPLTDEAIVLNRGMTALHAASDSLLSRPAELDALLAV
ncbi:ABC transporter ATP-binding protein [Rhizobium straminoryzae]|uniref:ABC transporter ATP-binding protein n=1 Tax=Rhizobium straminoryzae TaxID=1387186 RepID=A0A549T0G5_9HYPH|nr:ABC transporter ATP-binding protein [Rhizobium straminoryzae]TRL35346.1 ABC transporter ATP-binding protein [Rhizobium straminoryzae]